MNRIWLKKVTQTFCLILGHFFLALGVVGIFLPLLPTTPFLILAAIFYSRGSPTFEHWLKNHRVLGPPLQLWRQHGVIGKRAKVMASTMIGLSILWVATRPTIPMLGKGAMFATVFGVLVFLWTRPSKVK